MDMIQYIQRLWNVFFREEGVLDIIILFHTEFPKFLMIVLFWVILGLVNFYIFFMIFELFVAFFAILTHRKNNHFVSNFVRYNGYFIGFVIAVISFVIETITRVIVALTTWIP